jgi:hypothetical protein
MLPPGAEIWCGTKNIIFSKYCMWQRTCAVMKVVHRDRFGVWLRKTMFLQSYSLIINPFKFCQLLEQMKWQVMRVSSSCSCLDSFLLWQQLAWAMAAWAMAAWATRKCRTHSNPFPSRSVSTGKPFCHSRESGNANSISREFSGSRELIFSLKNFKKVTF